MIYYNWITTNYTNHCFNLFFVFKLFMICVSLLHYDFACLTSYINFTLFCKIVVSYSNQCINQASNKTSMTKHFRRNNCNSVVLGMGRSNEGKCLLDYN